MRIPSHKARFVPPPQSQESKVWRIVPEPDPNKRDVLCVTCGATLKCSTSTSPEVALAHLAECPRRTPYTHVPAWSTGWPYYYSVQNGDVAANDFTFECGWVNPSILVPDQAHSRIPVSGMSAKTWHPFLHDVTQETIAKARA